MKKVYTLLYTLMGCIGILAAQDSTHFVTTWKTTNDGISGDSSITIFTNSSVTFNYDIDWNNDGIFDSLSIKGNITHNFGDTGIFTIRIKGTFPIIEFPSTSDHDKIIFVDQWGTNKWKGLSLGWCTNVDLRTSDAPDLSLMTSLKKAFWSCSTFNGDISSWDVSTITDMRGIFYRCSNFNQDVGNWDVSNVTDFVQMFYQCPKFNQDIGGWDVSSAVDMNRMFRGNHLAPSIFNQDISNWDVSDVADFSDMFMYCDSFNVDIGKWDVSSATDMNYMFRSAISFNQDISGWDVDSVTNMQGAFQRATSFNQDLSSWDVSRVTNMWWMFDDADAFNQDISNWDVSNVTNMYGMFDDNDAFNQNLSDWDIKSVTTMRHMFARSALSRENYDSILIAWEAKPHKSNVEFYPYDMVFCHSDSARSELIKDGWIFNGDTKDCLTTGITENKTEGIIEVYPNPTNGLLNINLTDGSLIFIYDSNARLVRQFNLNKGANQIDLSKYPNGLYFIRNGYQSKKVMVHH